MNPPKRRGSDAALILGILLVTIGALYLARELGLIRWSWNQVWPLILLGLGALVIWQALRPGAGGASRADVARDGADELELRLSVGAGTFHVAGGGPALLEAASNADDLEVRQSRDGRRAKVHLRHARPWFPFSGAGASEWWVRIGEGVATFVEVEGGAGRFDLDLAAVRCVGVRLGIGAAEVRLVLPSPNGELLVKGSLGAAELTIQIPPGTEARVEVAGLVSVDGMRETPGFASATDRVLVKVDGGAASVKIR